MAEIAWYGHWVLFKCVPVWIAVLSECRSTIWPGLGNGHTISSTCHKPSISNYHHIYTSSPTITRIYVCSFTHIITIHIPIRPNASIHALTLTHSHDTLYIVQGRSGELPELVYKPETEVFQPKICFQRLFWGNIIRLNGLHLSEILE